VIAVTLVMRTGLSSAAGHESSPLVRGFGPVSIRLMNKRCEERRTVEAQIRGLDVEVAQGDRNRLVDDLGSPTLSAESSVVPSLLPPSNIDEPLARDPVRICSRE